MFNYKISKVFESDNTSTESQKDDLSLREVLNFVVLLLLSVDIRPLYVFLGGSLSLQSNSFCLTEFLVSTLLHLTPRALVVQCFSRMSVSLERLLD